MFPRFLIRSSSTFGKHSIFHTWQWFSAKNIYFLECYTVYCFKACQAIDSLTHVPHFLFGDLYLNLLFNFKVGPSSGLSSLISSIITLIIRIIKTMCFNNTTLMAELEGKVS